MRVNGDVVNQVGNLHGNGYADLHFIIPELVQALRVVEGPYDPRQGNFAVAGSADYELGLTRRGLTGELRGRLVRHAARAAAVGLADQRQPQLRRASSSTRPTASAQNRDARRATALGQLEDKLGEDGLWRLTTGAYLTRLPLGRRDPRGRLRGRPHGLLRHLRLRPGRRGEPRVRARRPRVPARGLHDAPPAVAHRADHAAARGLHRVPARPAGRRSRTRTASAAT